MDNFREWLSDNLRYILLGLAIILVLCISIFVVRTVRGLGSNQKPAPISQAETEALTAAETADTAQTESQSETQAQSEEALVENNAELLSFAQSYYTAVLTKDTDAYTKLVENVTEDELTKLQNGNAIEAYENITVYSKSGPEANSYVLLVCYDAKLANVDTLAPSLVSFYVKTAEDGSLYAAKYDSDAALTAQIKEIIAQSDVQALVSTVQARLEEAKSSDAALASALQTKTAETDSSTDTAGDSGAEANKVVWCTADEVNVRTDSTTSADVIGTLSYQAQVTRLEKLDNGWSKIRYGDTVGYVNSDYLTEDSSYFDGTAE